MARPTDRAHQTPRRGIVDGLFTKAGASVKDSYLRQRRQIDKSVDSRHHKAWELVRHALKIADSYGSIDGEHHKTWVIDQMVRALTGPGYSRWIADHKRGEDGPETYDWDMGIAP